MNKKDSIVMFYIAKKRLVQVEVLTRNCPLCKKYNHDCSKCPISHENADSSIMYDCSQYCDDVERIEMALREQILKCEEVIKK